MAHEIIIEVPLGGNPTISVNGVKGKSCKDLTKDFERELGGVVNDKETSEYHEQPERILNSSRR